MSLYEYVMYSVFAALERPTQVLILVMVALALLTVFVVYAVREIGDLLRLRRHVRTILTFAVIYDELGDRADDILSWAIGADYPTVPFAEWPDRALQRGITIAPEMTVREGVRLMRASWEAAQG